MLEDDGHWLKLMRAAAVPAEANICLHIEGSDVICTVTSDITREVELKVTCRVSSQGNLDQDCLTPATQLKSPTEEPLHAQLQIQDQCENNNFEFQFSNGQKLTEMLDLSFKDLNEVSLAMEIITPRSAVKMNVDSSFSESDYAGERCLDKDENDAASWDGNPEMERSVSPPIGNQDGTNTRTSTEPRNPERAKDLKNEENCPTSPTSELEDLAHRSPDPVSNQKTKPSSSGRLYKCARCAFYCYRQHILNNHLKSHSVPTIKEATGSGSPSNSARSFCTACNIKFISVQTYQVHKQLYCDSRHHEAGPRNGNQSPTRQVTELEHMDATVLSGNTMNTSTMSTLSSVIQPQAIFAAISTNPLILLPCSLVNGQGLVPHNGIISTGAGIVLPTSIAGSTSVESSGITIQIRQPQCDRQLTDGGSIVPMETTSFLNPLTALHALKSNVPSSSKRQLNEGDPLNLRKPRSQSDHCPTSETNNVEVKSEFSNAFQEAPLDLSVKKRKFSLSITPVLRPAVKRRNSSASSVPTSPPVQFSTTCSSSPETSHTRVSSPPAFSNDASCSSGFGNVLTTASVNDIQGLCTVSDRLSPVPPVLLSAVENSTTSQRVIHSLGGPPPKILKQGNNRCEDCNIVFYKYDNYLAHKRHYCAYRRRQESPESDSAVTIHDQSNTSDDNISNQDGMDQPGKMYASEEMPQKPANVVRHAGKLEFGLENIAAATPVSNHKPQSSVYCCDACGVKFSTSDNLNAHQTYYCSRKADLPFSKFNAQSSRRNSNKSREYPCGRCGELSSKGHEEMCCSEQWKCNYCDVVCPSIKTARRHLLTHTEIRGFCCTVCGYRGNTIRGMRTHVYEHLNGDHSQIEDLLAASVVVDSAGTPGRILRFKVQDCSDEDSNINTECKLLTSREEDTSNRVSRGSSVYSKSATSPIRITCNPDTFQPNSESEECSKSPPNHLLSSDSRDLSSNKELESNHSSYEHIHGSGDEKENDNESRDSVYRCGLNASTVCDVVIKAEEDSVEKIIPERSEESPIDVCNYVITRIKTEPVARDEHSDIENNATDKQDTALAHGSSPTSVICKNTSYPTSSSLKSEGEEQPSIVQQKPYVQKKKLRAQVKSSSEQKYCKSCDISFHHLSNFLAHKRFYCVSRAIENFQKETAPVQ